MEFRVKQIAELLEGEVVGNGETIIRSFSKIEEGIEGSLAFLANPKYTAYIYDTQASVVIVTLDFKPERAIHATLIKVVDPYLAFTKLLQLYDTYKRQDKQGIETPSFVHPTAKIGENVYLGAFAYIGKDVSLADGVKIYPHSYIGDNSTVGSGTVIHAGVKIYEDTIIGKDCTLHAGVVVGSDGFGFAPNAENQYNKIPQIGNVVIDDYVEIGANTTIDRATMGSTRIHKGVKLDNHIQIAHNVEIGENTVIASQTGIAGSSKIGKRNMIAGQVGVIGHITTGDDVKIAAQSGISHNVADNLILQGSPAYDIGQYRRSYVYFKKLPEIVKRIDALEKNHHG